MQQTMLNKQKVINSPNEILYTRVRIPVRLIYRNEDETDKLVTYMQIVKGIVGISGNYITGKILILFNENIISRNDIEKTLKLYLIKKTKSADNKVIDISNRKFDEEFSGELSLLKAFDYEKMSEQHENTDRWHSMDEHEIIKTLLSNSSKGLSNKVAKQKITEYGLNVLSEKKEKSIITKFVENISTFSSKLLLGVSLFSFVIGQVVDGVVVLIIVLMETSLSTVQQQKAEKSLYSLKNMLVHNAKTKRDGIEREIESRYLVPGDIIYLEAGDKVPADSRLLRCYDFKTNEASLTGECLPICKTSEICDDTTELAERFNMVYMGSDVLSGRAKAIVVSTGMNSRIGKIASILQDIKDQKTPLQIKMEKFTNKITKICLIIFVGVGSAAIFMGTGIAEVVTIGIGFSLSAIPESLPAIVAVAMSLSVQKMSEKNAIVRKLPAVEALGSANVICCDKTGTLTMNEMTVKKIFTDNAIFSVSGSGYSPVGSIELLEGSPLSEDTLKKLLIAGVLCNNSKLNNCNDSKWTVHGDPTEGALLSVARKYNIDEKCLNDNFPRIKEIPFDSSKRYMTVVVDSPEGKVAYCKGSLTIILEQCKTIIINGEERLLTPDDKKRVREVSEEMGDEALRVIAFGYKNISTENGDKSIHKNFVFIGLVGMEDPPREGVKESLKKCHRAGIKVVMITGDNKNTAAALGKQLGLLTDGIVISGLELDQMSKEELDSTIDKIEVFARTSPEQKHRIVLALKKLGYVVAMTGDGVNDAPAIKEANIGIAMGGNGSDIAKDVADITLVDDNFSTIVAAIEEGRNVTKKIRNATKYLITGSIGEILALLITSATIGILPLVSIQLLFMNVICETILGAPLVIEASSEDVMLEKPLKLDAPLIDKKLGVNIAKRSIGIGLTTFTAFEGAMLLGLGISKARTLAFTNLIVTHIINLYDCKSGDKLSNKYMNIAALSSVAMLAGTIYVPFISSFFKMVPLRVTELASIGVLSSLSRVK